MVIPVPEAESDFAYYDSLYAGEFRMPKQLIHIQPFTLEPEQADYDLDTEDETCLLQLQKRLQIGALQFEDMMEKLEKGSGQQLVTLQEARLLLKEDDELIQEVFEYWSRKRRSCKKPSLIPLVKQEKRDGSSTSDPYVAFRRRTEKMQTRKNRKNDEVSYEKMLKLRRDLSRAVSILEMIKRREGEKRDLLQLTLEIVEKRSGMADFGGDIMAEAEAQRVQMKPVYTLPLLPLTNTTQHRDYRGKEKVEVVRQKRKYEKKKQKVLPGPTHHTGPALFNPKDLNQYDFPSSDEEPYTQLLSGSSEAEEENDPDGVFAFRRRAGCQYHAALSQVAGWPWAGLSEGGRGNTRFRYSLTSLTSPRRCLGLARRRVGRGGRVLLDRARSDCDAHSLRQTHTHTQTHTLGILQTDPRSQATASSPTDTHTHSHTHTHTHSSTSSLQQLLLDIQSCRHRHFRPRPPPTPPRQLPAALSRLANGLGAQQGGVSRASASRPAPVITEEQYQQHQEQLVVFHRSLLAQQAGTAPPGPPHKMPSQTLDSASAQFAASALLSSEQLGALKSREDGANASNGLVAPSGVHKGLHHTITSSASSPTPPTHTNNGTPHLHGNAGSPSPAQALVGGALRVGVALSGHLTRPLAVPASALKMAASRQMPRVATTTAAMELDPRENHDQDKPALNSLTDSTVAMEVT
ncbi:enhancer of polycomb homolog 1-like isoform X2 [Clupea harengus]|nr:enhancer of polycomb homolog 1-like isoform X2 [Clupea harengus]